MHTLLDPQKVAEIKEKANNVLSPYLHIEDPMQRLLKIAEDHNIVIMQNNLYEMSGALRKEEKGWVIYVNAADSLQRKFFTIAHELGHYFLHKDKRPEFVDSAFVRYRDETQKFQDEELEANEFAGNLVMPEVAIRKLLGQECSVTAQNVLDLARELQVSPSAMAIRLHNIGYDVPRTPTAS